MEIGGCDKPGVCFKGSAKGAEPKGILKGLLFPFCNMLVHKKPLQLEEEGEEGWN